MAFRKQLGQIFSWICVLICIVSIIREFTVRDGDSAVLKVYPKIYLTERIYNTLGDSKQNDIGFSANRTKLEISKRTDRETQQTALDSSGSSGSLQVITKANDMTLHSKSYSKQNDNAKVEKLTEILKVKLGAIPSTDVIFPTSETCNTSAVIGNSCSKTGCLQLQLPRSLRSRIEQIVLPSNLQLNQSLKVALESMAAEIQGYSDIVVVTGSSSNHYLESQALLSNLHNNLLPHLRNASFLYYDLGLTEEEHKFVSSICRCRLLRFPFHLFPEFVSRLKCYTWKALIVNAVIKHANLVFWVDASIRFRPDPSLAMSLIERARHRGLQMGWSQTKIAVTTLPAMFHFFGDEACAYQPYNQGLSGVVIFHNELLIRQAILEPWAACSLSGRCMCLQDGTDLFLARISCHEKKGKYFYGVCHRFDQSALSLLLSKLYQEKVGHVILRDIRDYLDIKRGDRHPYVYRST